MNGKYPCQQLHGGTGEGIYHNEDGLCIHPECNPDNRDMKPLSSMSHEEKCREFAELNNIHWHSYFWVWTDMALNRGYFQCSCGHTTNDFEKENPTFLHAAELLEVMQRREDRFGFVDKYLYKNSISIYVPIDYILNPSKLLDACLEWSREHRLEGV